MANAERGAQYSNHYFTHQPTSRRRPRIMRAMLRGREFWFETDAGVFSRDRIDPGTRLLLQTVNLPAEGRMLDWGCGYGVIGIVAAALTQLDVWMLDINTRAVALTKQNAERNNTPNVKIVCGDGIASLGRLTFDVILTNPPIRSGNAVVFRLIDEAHAHLNPQGAFYLVAQTRQGAKTLAKRMQTVFGNVETVERESGYRVLKSVKCLEP